MTTSVPYRLTRKHLRLVLAIGLGTVAASPISAQERPGVTDVLSGLRNGGGWVSIPILAGRGSFSTAHIPTMGLSVAGCVNVWPRHSGSWQFEIREQVLGSVLTIDAQPGVGVPFQHDFGMQAQVDVDFRWSENRDTTLMLWIGVSATGEINDSLCQPSY